MLLPPVGARYLKEVNSSKVSPSQLILFSPCYLFLNCWRYFVLLILACSLSSTPTPTPPSGSGSSLPTLFYFLPWSLYQLHTLDFQLKTVPPGLVLWFLIAVSWARLNSILEVTSPCRRPRFLVLLVPWMN